MWVGYDDVMIYHLLKTLNFLNEDNFGNIENFDILLLSKHNGLGCSVI